MTGSDGSVAQELYYYPYGEIKDNDHSNIAKHKFTGQEWDAEYGLYYYGARYYDPKLARFVSADTIVPEPNSPQSFNRYAYTLNNPVIYIDPTGHAWVSAGTGGDYDKFETVDLWTGNAALDYTIMPYLTEARNLGGFLLNGIINSVIYADEARFSFMTDKLGMSEGDVGGFDAFFIINGAGVASIAKEFKSGIKGVTQLGKATKGGLPSKVYHYTDNATASLIEKSQLGLPGRTTYLTPKGNLSSIQAQIELALPRKNTGQALFEINMKALDISKASSMRRVTGNVFNRAGGGTEILYDGTIPLESIKRIR